MSALFAASGDGEGEVGPAGWGGRAHASLRPPTLAAAMPGAWLLLTLALTLTLTGAPGGRAQPEAAQREAEMAAEHPDLDHLLRQAERFLLLQDDVQRLRGDLGERSGG